jgi:hypothetical protein
LEYTTSMSAAARHSAASLAWNVVGAKDDTQRTLAWLRNG